MGADMQDREKETETIARAWWESLRAATGVGVPWDEASEEAKQSTREYVVSRG